MHNRTRTFWAAVVVLAGVVLSLPFRRGHDDSRATSSDQKQSASQVVVHRRQAPVPLHVSSHHEASPAAEDQVDRHEAPVGAMARVRGTRSKATTPAPALAENFPTMLDPLGLRSGHRATLASRIKSISAQPSLEVKDEPPEDESGSGVRWDHTISDRDTLTRIARRYWGSEEGYMAIYRTNRNILRSPDELPIGAVIQVPAKPPSKETP